jgi:hypothetical protein
MFAQDRPAVWSERRDLNPGPPVPRVWRPRLFLLLCQ